MTGQGVLHAEVLQVPGLETTENCQKKMFGGNFSEQS
jgi:hypothetical protein